MAMFNGWRPKDKTGICLRFYLKNGKAFIVKSGNKLVVKGDENQDISQVYQILEAHGINLSNLSLQQLNNVMAEKLLATFPEDRNKFQDRKSSFSNAGTNNFEGNTKTSADMHLEALDLNIESAPFRADTLKNCIIEIDTREPVELLSLFKESKFNPESVKLTSLELGDIRFTNTKTGDVLLIERKTVQDFQNSIYSSHAHNQAERYFNEVQNLQRHGKRMKVMWIIESQNDGARVLYNTLPKVQNVDGMISYLSAMLDQPVSNSFNMRHTVYQALKFAQCFFEQQLFYKLQTQSPLANRSGAERLAIRATPQESKDNDHGVTRAENNVASMLAYIPSIRLNVAKELAKTGKSYKEIVCMTIDELLAIKGIGEQSAKQIHSDFNKN